MLNPVLSIQFLAAVQKAVPFIEVENVGAGAGIGIKIWKPFFYKMSLNFL